MLHNREVMMYETVIGRLCRILWCLMWLTKIGLARAEVDSYSRLGVSIKALPFYQKPVYPMPLI